MADLLLQNSKEKTWCELSLSFGMQTGTVKTPDLVWSWYGYLYDDFRDESANDFLYQLALHGAQITVGLTF
jgi:hypothetical protein